MSQDGIAVMDGSKCIMSLRDIHPFLSAKYDIMKHPKYKYLSDYDKKNTFDPEKYLARIRRSTTVLKPEDTFTIVEIGGNTKNPAIV